MSDRAPAETDNEVGTDTRDDEETRLHDLPDGVGCTELWEHLSAERNADRTSEDDA